MKPRILINASTLVVGGGIQVGISFVEFASQGYSTDFEFMFAVSKGIYDGLPLERQQDSRVKLVRNSPARIVSGHESRRLLKELEKEFRPDLVYSLGSPSYTRFRTMEIGRYTNPWEIFADLPWSCLPFKDKIYFWLSARYRLLWVRNVAYFETQTEAAKAAIVKRLGVPENRVKVIPNAPNPVFCSPGPRDNQDAGKKQATVFCLAAPYRHKNLVIIPRVAAILKRRDPSHSYSFVLTIPPGGELDREIREKARRLGVGDMIANVGLLKMRECISWYENCDVVFLPTLLEVFSATHVEAMAMMKPIVTTDRDFCRSVCGDAALYFDPQSAEAAAGAIMAVVNDEHLRRDLVQRGKRRIETFPSPKKKHDMVFEWLLEIAHQQKGVVSPMPLEAQG
ncbi:MAG: glycosyltransferase [Deltaproteobacteria bacterium]|nr:glycosyltransferase [Deltaproteobacteria bacterium]